MKKIILFFFLMFGVFQQVSADSQGNIRYHLKLVENVLREVDTSGLTQEQKNNRFEKLDTLSDYTAEGKFPNNDINSELTSMFKGSNGNLCAVGYLMYSDSEYQDYVDEIVSSNNLIRIMTIQDDPIFKQWSEENGFSQLELAMIQPSYPGDTDINMKETSFLGFVITVLLYLLGLIHDKRKSLHKYISHILLAFSVIIWGLVSGLLLELFFTLIDCSIGINIGDGSVDRVSCTYFTGDAIYTIQVIGILISLFTLLLTFLNIIYRIYTKSVSKIYYSILGFNVLFHMCLFGLYNFT